MAFILRFTVKKGSAFRQSGKFAYAVARGSGFTVGSRSGGHTVNTQEQATRYETQADAARALADYVIASEWKASMWVKNPKIIEV